MAPLEPTEFAFQAPDPVCPPSSALETFPLADHRRYVSVDPFLGDQDEFRTICGYERAEIGDGEDMIVEDHAYVSVYTTLYRRWEDSANSRIQFWPEMPMGSDDLDDWERTATTRNDRDVRWEGCGPATQCGEGEEPTVRTHSSRWAFNGHVGNLDFDQVNVLYIAEEIPADVESRVVAIFRDVVLAVLDSYERVD